VSIIIEIRSAAGGEDSKMLAQDQLGIYSKYVMRSGL
jgi:protein subunit release factor A